MPRGKEKSVKERHGVGEDEDMKGEEGDTEANFIQGGTGWWREGLGHEPMYLSVNWKVQLIRMLRRFKQNPTELGSPILAINFNLLSEPQHFHRCELKPSGFCALPRRLKPSIFKDQLWTKVGNGRRDGR